MNGSLVSAVYQKKMANPDVTWETVEQTNIGLDFGFLNNTIYGELDWYSKDTKDILLALGIPHFIGLDAPEQNAGVVRNSGVEAMVGSVKHSESLHSTLLSTWLITRTNGSTAVVMTRISAVIIFKRSVRL